MFRVIGYLLIVISIIHVVIGVWIFAGPLTDIIQNGIFNTVAPDPFAPYFDREDAFWQFMIAAPLLLTLGQLCCWAEAQRITLPAFLGWNLLAISLVGVFLEPISGFWLLILPAFLILIASRRATTRLTKSTEYEDFLK
ncbi:MAG: hypothetical protein KME28_12850 [Pelatocladus maniniholoensis HA4357-MV3]|jgi:hypothetical protein|uniref:Uncharacterized protein n=1 Tax=Pelatocladus maniniholoensis HA4357-MV3 TaxID=1117104 RepID=A0A9E3H8G3_9NOST|nr:hypothetical protein [Pelatocladus maniniholoensis HA4357-MV3]BAZ70495.1 hypothetical protein NIES4106_52900 [Fischerella sp. NIES-4106]